MTKYGSEREKLYSRICRRYQVLCERYPETAPSRIWAVIGEEVGFSSPGVLGVLVRKGVYVPRSRKQKDEADC